MNVRARFYQRYGFSGIIGVMDCNLLGRNHPEHPEHVYVNRNHYHSLNVQLICDDKLTILNVNACLSWNDAFIWQTLNVNIALQNLHAVSHIFFLLRRFRVSSSSMVINSSRGL